MYVCTVLYIHTYLILLYYSITLFYFKEVKGIRGKIIDKYREYIEKKNTLNLTLIPPL